MQELISRIAAETGLSPEKAMQALGQILLYIKTEGTDPAVETMIDGTPGANEAIIEAGNADADASGLGGMFGGGGGIMALGSRLMSLGLDMDGIQAVARELVSHARRNAGDETVDRVIQTTPGLSQFA
ncbi:hypothetical protein [Aureimonas leprariae]|uniref:DUF2267 domain-containing protein n=1 Tax=Plantimonas leprariae TaxID=2615207 RepID=A0A7V7PPT4_9HYPH|nr:hypothetical protein [Aureimonas leprariae]KAB0680036.1 hypothetical protein F6X38_10740 [Aureimonas leprariae]